MTASAKTAPATAPVLAATVIRGASVYGPAELYETWRDQLGKPITRDSARAVVAAIERLYLGDGYSRPVVKVDGDLVASGMLRLEVLEPHLTRVTIGGDPGPYTARIETVAAPLNNLRPIRRDAVQSVLQRLRDLPGLTVSANTRRDQSAPNGYELTLDAEFAGIEGVVQVTNRGTEEIGPHFVLGQAVANSLFGQAEKFGLTFAAAVEPDEFHGGGGFIDLGVGSAGTRVALNGFRSLSKPDEEPVDLTDEYLRDKITLRVTQPLRLDSSASGALSLAMELDDLEIERDGAVLRDERLRIVEAGVRLSWRGSESTQYLSSLEVRRGIDGLGSQLVANDLASDPRRLDFTLARTQFVRLARFGDHWTWRLDVLGQYTGYVLPYSERFKIGGERLGRGFEVTEIAGDLGAGGKMELRRELPGVGVLPGKPSVYGFYDYGATWKQDIDDVQSAATVGAGFGLRGERLNGYLEVAAPLTHADVEGDETAKVFAEISYRF